MRALELTACLVVPRVYEELTDIRGEPWADTMTRFNRCLAKAKTPTAQYRLKKVETAWYDYVKARYTY